MVLALLPMFAAKQSLMKDKSWEQYGDKEPYFGVCTDPRYKTKNLNEAALKDFFQSGEQHVSEVLTKLKSYFPLADLNSFQNVLDFGCGTGRLLIPFAQRFPKVTGVDIASGMLSEAKKNLEQRNLHNVELVQSADITTHHFATPFDFVHTYIVLQHIPVKFGYPIIDKLIDSTKQDGYGMIQFTYANHLSAATNRRNKLKAEYKWYHQLSNILKGQSPNVPLMQMNNYDLPQVFSILKKYKLKQTCLDFTDHGGFLGVCIYFRK
jgi:2-polyprenyl-3-methyl-5-hydroxy-6-metoxy-1,4-benzoquinol methylase